MRSLNVQWLRSHMALVSQTPTLFPASIFENIAAGKVICCRLFRNNPDTGCLSSCEPFIFPDRT